MSALDKFDPHAIGLAVRSLFAAEVIRNKGVETMNVCVPLDAIVRRINDKRPHVTVTQGISGWFAVAVCWNDASGGFWEPENTGVGRYATREEAEAEGKEWAASEDVEFWA